MSNDGGPAPPHVEQIMKQLLVRALFLFFYVLLRIIPVRLQPGLACKLGDIAYNISGKRGKTVLNNLRIAFRDRFTDEELEGIARRSYQNLMMSVFEFIRFNLYKKEDIERMVDVVGAEHVRAALDRGKGIVIISAHFATGSSWPRASTPWASP